MVSRPLIVGAMLASPACPRTETPGDARAAVSRSQAPGENNDPPADAASASAASAFLGDDVQVLDTEHFSILYDTSYDALRPLLGRLEGTYDGVRHFCIALNLPIQETAQRLSVVLFRHYADFAAYAATLGLGGRAMAGAYDQRTNASVFCHLEEHPSLRPLSLEIERVQTRLEHLTGGQTDSPVSEATHRELRRSLATLYTQRRYLVKRFNRLVIQHEAAHQMLFNLGVHVRSAPNPTWLVEGLACQFEVPQPGAARGNLAVNHVRLGDFRRALDVDPGIRQYPRENHARAVAEGRLLPLRELITGTHSITKPDGNEALRYGQAWALVYFLYRKDREAFAAYLANLMERRAGERVDPEEEAAAFRSAFGEPDDDFERTWIQEMLELRFDPKEGGS